LENSCSGSSVAPDSAAGPDGLDRNHNYALEPEQMPQGPEIVSSVFQSCKNNNLTSVKMLKQNNGIDISGVWARLILGF
jgi:hypothetical protein